MDNNLEELMRMETRSKRIRAIAMDLLSDEQRYSGIDPWILAEKVLNLDLRGGDENTTSAAVGTRQSLDDWVDEYPISEHIELILDMVDPTRADEWRKQVDEIISGEREEDIELTEEERDLLEEQLSLELIRNDGGWVVMVIDVIGDDEKITFEVSIGDAGDPFEVIGPYELARGQTNFSDDIIVSEWF